MKLITETHKVNTVAKRWRAQYPEGGSVRCKNNDQDRIYQELLALDHKTATAADVEKIIGNDSWAGPTRCQECGVKVPNTVLLGDDDYCESIEVCESCLTHALRLLK